MLNLTLREEFRGNRLKGTAIELSNDKNTGATQMAAEAFLQITYPTRDLLKGIEAVGPNQGRPVVVIGERGLGKSHLMAVLYHAVNDAASTRVWLNHWAATLGDPQIAKIALRDGMQVIGESLHRQRCKFLWDLLFDHHPHGAYIEGKWAGMGAAKTDIPSDQLILELLQHRPTMLLLDEFQTWYDGLTNSKQHPWKNWAFTFIQILSEIAKQHPDLLVLVISVRNGGGDAYQQGHRAGRARDAAAPSVRQPPADCCGQHRVAGGRACRGELSPAGGAAVRARAQAPSIYPILALCAPPPPPPP